MPYISLFPNGVVERSCSKEAIIKTDKTRGVEMGSLEAESKCVWPDEDLSLCC